MKKILLVLVFVLPSVIMMAGPKITFFGQEKSEVDLNRSYDLNHSKVVVTRDFKADYDGVSESAYRGQRYVSSSVSQVDGGGYSARSGNFSSNGVSYGRSSNGESGNLSNGGTVVKLPSLKGGNDIILGQNNKLAHNNNRINDQVYPGEYQPPMEEDDDAPLGDAVLPLLLLAFVFAGFKFWKK